MKHGTNQNQCNSVEAEEFWIEKGRLAEEGEWEDVEGDINMAGSNPTIKVPSPKDFWKLVNGMGFKGFSTLR